MPYASRTDFVQIGLPAKALTGIEDAQLAQWLLNASAKIDTYLRSRYSLPLTGDETATPNTYPGEIVRCACIIAAYDGLTVRGYHPDQLDANFRLRYEDCIRWLEQLATGAVSLDGSVDATPTVNEGAPKVFSAGTPRTNSAPRDNEQRGW